MTAVRHFQAVKTDAGRRATAVARGAPKSQILHRNPAPQEERHQQPDQEQQLNVGRPARHAAMTLCRPDSQHHDMSVRCDRQLSSLAQSDSFFPL